HLSSENRDVCCSCFSSSCLLVCGTLQGTSTSCGGEAGSALRVEQVGPRKIRREDDVIAGTTECAIANGGRDLLPIHTAVQLGVGAGGLDHDDLGAQTAAAADRAMLGSNPVEH